jgi:beta-phosphoglucomutase-like phosphatase (HAD superfamily)
MDTLDSRVARARALIFDCDNTLIDSGPLHARAWIKGFGHGLSPDWYEARKGLSQNALMDVYEAEFGAIDRSEVVRKAHFAYLSDLSTLREISAVAAIARQRHGQKPMAVASGGQPELVMPSLTVTGLSGLFDTVVTIADTGRGKPEPDLFIEAARRLNVLPQDCLVFEDSHEGLEAAHRAGMPAIDIATLIKG